MLQQQLLDLFQDRLNEYHKRPDQTGLPIEFLSVFLYLSLELILSVHPDVNTLTEWVNKAHALLQDPMPTKHLAFRAELAEWLMNKTNDALQDLAEQISKKIPPTLIIPIDRSKLN